jgi:hypothetical protein
MKKNLEFSIWSYELKIVAKGKVKNQIDNLTKAIKAIDMTMERSRIKLTI